MTKYYKSFNDLTYVDGFMFKKVMTDPKTLPVVKWIIEKAAEREVKELQIPQYKRTINAVKHGVVFEDEECVYAIVMQTYNTNLRKMAESYLSRMDIDVVEAADYDIRKLKKKYVIFIMTKNFIGIDGPIDREEMRLVEHLERPSSGFRNMAYIDTAEETEDPDLKAFFRFVQENVATNEMTNLLAESIIRVKKNDECKKKYMDDLNARKLEQ